LRAFGNEMTGEKNTDDKLQTVYLSTDIIKVMAVSGPCITYVGYYKSVHNCGIERGISETWEMEEWYWRLSCSVMVNDKFI
jgi:hypothetical protein